MTGAPPHTPDETRSQRVSSPSGPLGYAASALNAIGSIGIFLLMCLICLDVAGRYFFGAPIMGVTEIAEISIVAIVFFQLADTLARDRMPRADIVVNILRNKRPRIAGFIDAFAALCGVALMLLIDYGTIPGIINDYRNGYYIGTVGLFTFPSWPIKAAIALGASLAAVQLMAIAVRAVRVMWGTASRGTP
ncbi:TRAP transporter small permease subunit [Nitratireductor sp. CAU 1489]|uniref:TRAP transporter small permease protein n=1 Tax=Nitratireductor arenosus TaxID=2682096 RepID=A0A844Q7G2_9HYPH|nr:TRAP transporter small permease [Nitratireductor arenosus]MVA96016.1 TRAP transporter small permease subunit [Nitratireductor arenosus]